MSEYEMSGEIRSLEQQLDVAREFCRQYQLENKQLRESTANCYEKNLNLNLENFELKAQLEKISQMYYNDEVFVVKNGEGFFTDKFHDILDDFDYERED